MKLYDVCSCNLLNQVNNWLIVIQWPTCNNSWFVILKCTMGTPADDLCLCSSADRAIEFRFRVGQGKDGEAHRCRGRGGDLELWSSWCWQEHLVWRGAIPTLETCWGSTMRDHDRRKLRSQTSDSIDTWKSKGGKSQRREEKRREGKGREEKRRDEKRREEKVREEKESEDRRQKTEDAGARKGRKVAKHCVLSNDLWLWRVEK